MIDLLNAPLAELKSRKANKEEQALLTNGLLRTSSIFHYCSEKTLSKVSRLMNRAEFKQGEVLMHEGDPQHKLFILKEGKLARLRVVDNQIHQVEMINPDCDNSRSGFGALHVLRSDPTYATALAETDGVAFTLHTRDLNRLIDLDPAIAKEIVYSLSMEVLRMTRVRTPLLEQTPKPHSIFATSVGAIIESYYRSGLNAWLNAQLSGKPAGSLFPNFHIQIPTRVMYINGLKLLRSFFSEHLNPYEWKHHEMVKLGLAIAPGVGMTPISSILEACNAEHMNPEPLTKRWTRGLIPRGVREVIFGFGINQLSDACEEWIGDDIENIFMRTMAGSMMAGVAAGYLSHVPHNISTMKLLNPSLTYSQISTKMVEQNLHRTSRDMLPGARRLVATLLTVVAPKGCLIRTLQICGSFIIINGTIDMVTHSLKGKTKPLNPAVGIKPLTTPFPPTPYKGAVINPTITG